MRLRLRWTTFRRFTATVTMAAILLGGGSEANRMAAYAKAYRQKALRYQAIETELINSQKRWEGMAADEQEAAAKFRRGEWGRGEDKYKVEFDNIMRTFKETHDESVVNKLQLKHFESMAKSCDESAKSSRDLAACFGRKALYFAGLRQKYERAARAPWWTVPPDPPEPK